jgi:Cu(I)/Ag(I) efflux system membrane fusion protein
MKKPIESGFILITNLKYPIGLRLQGWKTNPISGIWIKKQALVTIGTQK